MIVQLSDFTGSNHVAGDIYSKASQELLLLEGKENSFIYQILGTTLGQEFINDLAGDPSTPQTAKWQTVFSFFNFDVFGPEDCVGLKSILVSLFRNEYVNGQLIINSINGNVNVKSEAADNEGTISKNTILYNRTVFEICKLQAYIIENSDIYSDFEGLRFEGQLGL